MIRPPVTRIELPNELDRREAGPSTTTPNLTVDCAENLQARMPDKHGQPVNGFDKNDVGDTSGISDESMSAKPMKTI